MQQIDKNYVELVAIKRITEWKKAAQYDNTTEDKLKNEFKTLTTHWLANKLQVGIEELEEIRERNTQRVEKITRIYNNQFSEESGRREHFKDFEEFFKTLFGEYWGDNDENIACCYCGSTQEILSKVFEKNLISSKKFSQYLQIERKKPNEKYTKDNVALICPLCNNAKSDMINEANFKEYFAKSIGEFLSNLCQGKITNKLS